jgi:serine/threonine protein kinase
MSCRILQVGEKKFSIVRVVFQNDTKAILVVVNEKYDVLVIKDTDLLRVNIENPKKEVKILEKIKKNKNLCPYVITHEFAKLMPATGRYVIGFPFVSGLDLYDLVQTYNEKKQKLDCSLITDIFTQSVFALSKLHKNKIVHLDVSLENLFWCNPMPQDGTREKKVKFIDFGQGEFGKESVKGKRGKLPYMCPEMFEPQEYCPYKADIWAIGMVLFNLINQVMNNKAIMINDVYVFMTPIDNYLQKIIKKGCMGFLGFFNTHKIYDYPNWVPRILSLCICPVEKRLPNATALLEKINEELSDFYLLLNSLIL